MKVFRHFDTTGEDSINFEKAKPMAKAFELTQEELVMIFNEIDLNGDGTIEIDEWLDFLLKTSNKNFIKRKFVEKLKDKEWVENLGKIKDKPQENIEDVD